MNTRLASALSRVVAATFAAVLAVMLVLPSFGSQNSCIMPNTGTVSGLTLVNDISSCTNSLMTLYSGGSAPAGPLTGMLWWNTTSNNVEQYDGTSWQVLWNVDTANHLSTPDIGGGVVTASLTSAATVDVGSVNQSFVTITGTTTITSLGASALTGTVHIIKFSGSLVLTYNATSLILPTGFSITTQAGDIAIAIALGSGNWQVISYTPATGFAVASSFPLGAVLYGDFGAAPGTGVLSKFVYGYGQALTRTSYPAYTTAVTRAQSGTLTPSNATITAIGNTQGFAVGMPVEAAGINATCTIASFVANTSITLNSSSCVTGSGSATVTVFLTGYGSGGSGSTVGVKDCRGRVLAGRDDLGGTAAGRLTTGTGGFGVATGNNIAGGQQSIALGLTQLPTGITSSGSITGSVTPTGVNIAAANSTISNAPVPSSGGVNVPYSGGTWGNATSGNLPVSGTASVTSNNTSGAAHPTVQPTVLSDCIVAVLP